MHLKKRFHVLSLAIIAAALFAIPSTASARNAQCVFQGVTGTIAPGVMLIGQEGDYTFATSNPATTQCREGTGTPQQSKIESRGHFVNTICGTGTATGGPAATDTRVDVGATTPPTWDYDNIQYHIDFRAANGTLNVHSIQGLKERRPDGTDPGTSPDPDGHVVIIPTGGSCNDPGGVTQFTVAGGFSVDW